MKQIVLAIALLLCMLFVGASNDAKLYPERSRVQQQESILQERQSVLLE